MTEEEDLLQELKDMIKLELDECEPHVTPWVCAHNTPENYKNLERSILDRVLKSNGNTSVSTAIDDIEREYNPNMLND